MRKEQIDLILQKYQDSYGSGLPKYCVGCGSPNIANVRQQGMHLYSLLWECSRYAKWSGLRRLFSTGHMSICVENYLGRYDPNTGEPRW